jgi:hypothetical protein
LNVIEGDIGTSDNFIGGGYQNTITSGNTVSYSTIVGGSGNTINHTNTHIIGSNITTVSADTTYVESLIATGDITGANTVTNETDIYGGTTAVSHMITLSQGEYDSISGSTDAGTMYIII